MRNVVVHEIGKWKESISHCSAGRYARRWPGKLTRRAAGGTPACSCSLSAYPVTSCPPWEAEAVACPWGKWTSPQASFIVPPKSELVCLPRFSDKLPLAHLHQYFRGAAQDPTIHPASLILWCSRYWLPFSNPDARDLYMLVQNGRLVVFLWKIKKWF